MHREFVWRCHPACAACAVLSPHVFFQHSLLFSRPDSFPTELCSVVSTRRNLAFFMNSDLWIPQFSQQKNPSRRCPKGLHMIAQGKQTRVLRVFVSPWVEETPDSRPSKQRWFGRRVTEAETGRGFIAASATCRTKADVTTRPPPGVLIEPRATQTLARLVFVCPGLLCEAPSGQS